MTQFTNEFSKKLYTEGYQIGNEKEVDDTLWRVAEYLASAEKKRKRKYWALEFFKVMQDFKCLPGSRIIANSGDNFKKSTMFNCFADGFVGEHQDSMDSIFDALRRQGMILRSEGGYGFCADVLRPRGGFIEGIGVESPGTVKLLELWDKQSEVITEGSGNKSENKLSKGRVRKGAQMVNLSMWHPEIEKFIKAKSTTNKLTKFNMSCLVDDNFMEACKNNKPWDLIFPDFDKYKVIYNKEWNGIIDEWINKGYPIKIYKHYENANELGELLLENMYKRNEPGCIFIGRVNYWNNLWYCENIRTTNACSEIPLPIGGVCLLGNFNLTQFVKGNNWDYEKLNSVIPTFIRMLDNVNDLSYLPLEINRIQVKTKRRMGIGSTGYASALLMMGYKYGSPEALKITQEYEVFLVNRLYQASSLLAKEKGSFKVFDKKKYLQGNFIKTLWPGTQTMIGKYGIRNSHLCSLQPTGDTSILMNNVSSSAEPIFDFEVLRTTIESIIPKDITLPKVNWEKEEILEGENWIKNKEGDDLILKLKGTPYKYDNNRGLTKECLVHDYGVQWLKANKLWNKVNEAKVNVYNLPVEAHLSTMKVFAKYLDSSMSKTINLPKNFSYEKYKDIFWDLYNSGVVKGFTTYREGTMASVLSRNNVYENGIPIRPKELDCTLVRFVNNKEKWIAFVGLLEDKPYEIFTGKIDEEILKIPYNVTKGKIVREKEQGISRYDFYWNGKFIKGLSACFDPEFYNYAKYTSAVLRHKMPIENIVNLIEGLNLGQEIGTWKNGVARALKPFIKDGIETKEKCEVCGAKLIYMEGCKKCSSCSWSKC